ncbi:unnamed protein product [Ilex paraguariensis]|uniref:Uncharacterized protein n=1 Tax=Ilex paraguariensis TaxID=185542 RepID=A0ABC8TP90_9AQUA
MGIEECSRDVIVQYFSSEDGGRTTRRRGEGRFHSLDLSKTLSELGLTYRQALIVIPHHRAVVHNKSSSSQTNSTHDISSSSGSNEGYIGFAKRMLSYLNPFSYIRSGASSSNSAQETESSMWQYRPNPTLQNNLRDAGGPYTVHSSNQSTPPTGANNSNNRKPSSSSGFGSNIHTLKHDDDDNRFADRNAFWNGNSTQYGGDNNGK